MKKTKNLKVAREQLSKAEITLKNMLKKNSYKIKFQEKVKLSGEIADFYSPSINLVILVDGSDTDNKRAKNLKKAGFILLKFDSFNIINYPDLVEIEIFKKIDEIN